MANIWIKRVAGGVLCALTVWFVMSERGEFRVSAAGSCEGLMSLALPTTTITSAKIEPSSASTGVKLAPPSAGRGVSIT